MNDSIMGFLVYPCIQIIHIHMLWLCSFGHILHLAAEAREKLLGSVCQRVERMNIISNLDPLPIWKRWRKKRINV